VAGSPRTGRRSKVRPTDAGATESTTHALLLGLAVLILLAAVGFVIWFLVQALLRVSGPPAPPSDPDSRGQLDDETPNGDPA